MTHTHATSASTAYAAEKRDVIASVLRDNMSRPASNAEYMFDQAMLLRKASSH
ncbi:hypothetical protein AAP_02064 [Ascosphaera apis ARSEF 7405]|uniref:Uncharacterized protein n=1 Tax=Ascosphaera apis ARSEF 7405 TaxID=392613 RepID=A0A168AIR6_9EURO|nr:hypothetical protein AAP_02064 [Ascosphaera apis ARSEF 7405]